MASLEITSARYEPLCLLIAYALWSTIRTFASSLTRLCYRMKRLRNILQTVLYRIVVTCLPKDPKPGLLCQTTTAVLPVVLPSDDSKRCPRYVLRAGTDLEPRETTDSRVATFLLFLLIAGSMLPFCPYSPSQLLFTNFPAPSKGERQWQD